MLFLSALGLCSVDLFNLLGYESALVLAVVAAVAGVRQGVHAAVGYRLRISHSAALGEHADGAPLLAVLSCYGRALLPALAMLVAPLLVLLLNGLRVRNCNYLSGLEFFAMLPVLSMAVAAAVGVTCGLWVGRPWRALAVGYGVVVLSLLWAGWRFLGSPAIYAYDPFFGFFPGALYDEDLAISGPFYWARTMHALWVFFALAATASFLDGYTLQARLQATAGRRGVKALTVLLLGLATLMFWRGGALGIYTDVPALESFLSGTRITPHFVIHYRPGGAVDHDIALYAREHELRYEQLHELLGIEPTWRPGLIARLLRLEGHGPNNPPIVTPGQGETPRVVSYIFDSYEHKRRWMGAANTDVAKPWRREIYLNHEPWPHSVLRHELAHVFAGAGGDPVLRLALRYGLPQPGLIEGLAVAADFRASYGGLLPHQAVKALREARLEPPLESVLSLDFWRLPGPRAYPVAGSFCHFLLEKYGAAKLLALYGTGGRPADFGRVYGTPFSQLKQQWVELTDHQPLDAKAREVERERMRRPAVFHKVCAHELAVRQQKARAAAGRGDYDEAVRLLRAVCLDDPAEPQHLTELGDLLWNAGHWDDAEQAARTLLAYPGIPSVLQGRAWSRLGDLAVARGDLTQAAADYERAEELPSDENSLRQLVARRVALGDAQAGPYLLSVLVGVTPGSARFKGRPPDRGEAVTVYLLTQAIAAAPELGLSHYILGRLLHQRSGYTESATELERSLILGLPDARFDRQALMLLGQGRLLGGDPASAISAWERLRATLPATELGQAAELADYLDRARRWNTLLKAPATAGEPPH